MRLENSWTVGYVSYCTSALSFPKLERLKACLSELSVSEDRQGGPHPRGVASARYGARGLFPMILRGDGKAGNLDVHPTTYASNEDPGISSLDPQTTLLLGA